MRPQCELNKDERCFYVFNSNGALKKTRNLKEYRNFIKQTNGLVDQTLVLPFEIRTELLQDEVHPDGTVDTGGYFLTRIFDVTRSGEERYIDLYTLEGYTLKEACKNQDKALERAVEFLFEEGD